MVEWMIKTIKHGITTLSRLLEYVKNWDLQIQHVLFGYKCGMQASTKFSPFLWSLLDVHLKVDNHLNMLTQELDMEVGVKKMVEQVIAKMELIIGMHKTIMGNVEKSHQK